MAQTICVLVSASDRARLEATVANRKALHKHVQRAKLILESAGQAPVQRIAATVGVSRPMVWRWQQRFAEAGVEGLLRDKTRKPGKAPVPAEVVARVVALTCSAPLHQATHWTGRAMAKTAAISLRSVQRIWQAHELQPHRIRSFKRSRDPNFEAKLRDVVGLYVDPPQHAVILSLDEKTQIQALDRTQPGLPLKRGKCATMTHDYKRNGTTTLFAALNVLKGEVIGQGMKRHRHQEFLKFLRTIDRNTPKNLDIHGIVDNYATHKKQEIRNWLEKHPRFHFHFIPTSASWLNLVERWFAEITRKRLRRGVFHSVQDLENAILQYIAHTNANPQPFVWTKKAGQIIAKVNNCKAVLETLH